MKRRNRRALGRKYYKSRYGRHIGRRKFTFWRFR